MYSGGQLYKPVKSHSRARRNILVDPQTFTRTPSREKIFEFFFSKQCTLVYFIFLSDGGPPNVEQPWGLTPVVDSGGAPYDWMHLKTSEYFAPKCIIFV